jgi:hypothetical protein|tara:strand:+ start:1047 stop:1211 length:165 start_codon:yes stop_codon:yes gene_type:complete
MNKKTEEITEEQRLRNKSEEVARNTWDSWIVDLEEADQPDACSIDDDDCEACGS